MSAPSTFYIIWSPKGARPPKHQHHDWYSASTEAERLALQHPGEEFYVMAAHRLVKTTKPVEIIDFDTGIELPF